MKAYSLYPCFEHWLHGGQIYLYSDPHFNDVESQAFRGWDDTMSDDEQVRRINSKVGKNDTLIILGDIGDTNYVKKLRGYKVLIMGNHDAGAINYRRTRRDIEIACSDYEDMTPNEMCVEAAKLFPGNEMQQEAFIEDLEHKAWVKARDALKNEPDFIGLDHNIHYSDHMPFQSWTAHYDNGLFDEVYEGPVLISPKILLSHEPVAYPFAFNIHGHDHSGKYHAPNNLSMNVCAEHIKYRPISLKDISVCGLLAPVPDIHRVTIDQATERKRK